MTASRQATNVLPTTDRLATLRLQLMAGEMAERIGRRIRQRRLEVGLERQRELADKIPDAAVSNQTISNWERGIHRPSDRYIEMLAEALAVEVDYFFRPEENESATPDHPMERPLGSMSNIQLDRIEAKLDDALSRPTPPPELQEALELLRQIAAVGPSRRPAGGGSRKAGGASRG